VSELPKYLALLRGINVGGHNKITKDELKATFEALGGKSVRTYIQSGNILFRHASPSLTDLNQAIETELSTRFNYPARAVVLSESAFQAALASAPLAWGMDADEKHNALFTYAEITPDDLLAGLKVQPKDDLETLTTGPGVVFWSISKAEDARTAYTKLPAASISKKVTIRNHNTVFKLRDLFDQI
jgi:uncharacterized protein (DUF1697 family)